MNSYIVSSTFLQRYKKPTSFLGHKVLFSSTPSIFFTCSISSFFTYSTPYSSPFPSFFLSLARLFHTPHSNELKSSHTPLTHSPHFNCEIKAAFLVCNHNAIAPLSHCLCAPIATTLRTAYIQRNFKEITLGHRIKRKSPSTFIQNNKKEMFLRLHRAKSNERTAVKHRSKTVLK